MFYFLYSCSLLSLFPLIYFQVALHNRRYLMGPGIQVIRTLDGALELRGGSLPASTALVSTLEIPSLLRYEGSRTAGLAAETRENSPLQPQPTYSQPSTSAPTAPPLVMEPVEVPSLILEITVERPTLLRDLLTTLKRVLLSNPQTLRLPLKYVIHHPACPLTHPPRQ